MTTSHSPPSEGVKENPPDPDATLVGDESSPVGIEALPGRLQRYAKAKRRSTEMGAYLRRASTDPDSTSVVQDEAEKCATRLECCAEWLHFRHYFTVDQLRLVAGQFCQLTKLCPMCAIRRGARNLQAYLDRFMTVQLQNPSLIPVLLTFTVKNGPDLGERCTHLRKCLKKAINRGRQARSGNGRGRTEFRKMAGAVGSFEVTNKGNGWHPHVHLVAMFEELPDPVFLSSEWLAITGDSFIVDARPINVQDPVGAFCEVFKYAMKFQDMSLSDNWKAHLELKRVRLLVSFGCFYGVQEPPLTDDPLEDLPYIDMFFRYLGGGYSYDKDKEIVHQPHTPRSPGGIIQIQRCTSDVEARESSGSSGGSGLVTAGKKHKLLT